MYKSMEKADFKGNTMGCTTQWWKVSELGKILCYEREIIYKEKQHGCKEYLPKGVKRPAVDDLVHDNRIR